MAIPEFSDNVIPGPAFKRARQHPDKVYLISRFDERGVKTPDQLHQVTWGQADRIVRDFGRGLRAMGFKAFDRLAAFGPNRPRWIYACMAAIGSRGVHVPIYPNSKEDDVWWILQDSGARFVVCGSMSHAQKALLVKDRVETLEKIILMDPLPDQHDDFIMGFDEVVELGKKSGITDEEIDERVREVQEDDLAAIIYTSGTTGKPKGVMLTHKSFVSQRVAENEYEYTDNEVFLAHLPMCHSFGFSSDLLNAGNIGGILFVADSIETAEMRKNLKDCRPTVMSSVPRLWEKLYMQILQTIDQQPPFKKKLVTWALKVGGEAFKLKSENKPVPLLLGLQSKLADRLFMKVKEQVGLDRLKYSYTGGGPIDPKIIYFFGGMGLKLYQGFGLTETAPIIFASTPRHDKIGCVGRPLPNVQVKIAPDGEILVKAPQVMKGYYNNPEATAEVLSADEWFATGDIGEVDADGFLKITDRKKELLKTSGGKYVAPQPIENHFNTDPYVEMVSVVGDGRKFVSALVVPDFENIRAWLKDNSGEEIADNAKLIEDPKVKELIEQRIQLVNQTLARYEQIKKYAVLSEPFSELTGELTPSLKKKRRVIEKKYKDKIDALYPND
ncbi:MAG TPA: long-chain fatty acid--CoA ligase [bacterium]|nr:long-chain fatty acid--CoA ligase [bacterium]